MTTSTIEYFIGMPINIPNKVTKQEKTHHISYNDRDISIYGSDTTALYIKETSQFLILDGNHTSGYDVCDSLQECVDYFYKNVKLANSFSEHGKIFTYKGEMKSEYVKGGY